MKPLGKNELIDAANLVYRHMSATPQYPWPLLNEALGATVWVKHENHTPTGAFKVRGGITLIDWLKRTHPGVEGVITATRGNHGQSQARAATAAGLTATILVPHGNSVEKNAAMRAFGAELIEHGHDFDEARIEADRLAEERGLFPVPPFHEQLVRGVASYALELFTAAPDLDVVYAPVGCGSGICGLIQARDALGLRTEVVGVVSTEAAGVKRSFEAGRLIETESANTFADGMAVRVPVKDAFDIYSRGAARILSVNDDEIAEAIRLYYSATHNIAEGAGAAALAGLISEKDKQRGREVAVVLSGGNIDRLWYKTVLGGATPSV